MCTCPQSAHVDWAMLSAEGAIHLKPGATPQVSSRKMSSALKARSLTLPGPITFAAA